jgi:2-iminobutanoate/2-iminopropanoate deaminase
MKAVFVLAAALLSMASAASAADKVEYLNSGKVVPKTLPFSEAVRVGDTLHLSGQVALAPGTITFLHAAHSAPLALRLARR